MLLTRSGKSFKPWTIWFQKIFVSQTIFRLTNMQVVYTDMPLGYSASFPHFPPVFLSTLFSHPFSYSSSLHLPFRHRSFISIVSSSSSPHHPPFFFILLLLFSTPSFLSSLFLLSFSLISIYPPHLSLFPSLFILITSLNLPLPAFSFPSSLSLSCPYVLPPYMSPFPPASFLFPHLSLSSSSPFLSPSLLHLICVRFPNNFFHPFLYSICALVNPIGPFYVM